jgi:hypothetical protein
MILIKRHGWVTRAKMLLVLRENVAIVISTESLFVLYTNSYMLVYLYM